MTTAKRKRPQRAFPESKPEKQEGGAVAPMTPEEMAIAARVAAQSGNDWEHPVGEDSAIDYGRIGKDPFALPKPAQELKDRRKYAFRWITRKPERIDEIHNKPYPFKWRICNRTTTPFLKDFVDPVLGCVCREDQVLVYKPWAWFEAEQEYKRGLADVTTQTGDLTTKHGQDAGDSMEWVSGKRSLESKKSNRVEVRGDDVPMLHETEGGFENGAPAEAGIAEGEG